MAAPYSHVDILTDEEHDAWHDRDKIEFYAWYARMVHVDLSETDGPKAPRHRYNKKNPKFP